ncbi:MAG: Gfo/Idh/MocA family oxidoreductase [Bacteroidota bacterium]
MEGEPFFRKSPIRWGIIGCGNVTEVKSGPPYQSTKDFELTMVMRRDVEKAKDYTKRHKVPQWTTNAADLIENPEIDAVYIATPPDSHKFYGLKVAEAGKPCCIEKPMAPCYADSLEIYTAFENRKIPLFIAYYRRSLPRFKRVKQWLDEGCIGEVRHLHWVKTRTTSPLDKSGDYNWRTDAKIAPGGYFDDLASHGLNLFTYLMGDIVEASGIAANQQGLYSSYDSISGSWKHKNGITGSGTWNFGSYQPIDTVEILGTKGEIHFSVLGEAPLELISDDGNQSVFIEHPKHLHQYHVENIKKHLFGKGKHPSLGHSGLHTSWVMDKILGLI